jgi:hypothetical protein
VPVGLALGVTAAAAAVVGAIAIGAEGAVVVGAILGVVAAVAGTIAFALDVRTCAEHWGLNGACAATFSGRPRTSRGCARASSSPHTARRGRQHAAAILCLARRSTYCIGCTRRRPAGPHQRLWQGPPACDEPEREEVLVSKRGAASVGGPDFEYGRNPLDSLSAAERVIFGRLVMRQLRHGGPTIDLALKKYGPEGTVRLCGGRALGGLLLALCFLVVGLSLAGQGVAAGVCVAPILVVAVLAVMRFASAGIAGRRWRSAR